MTETQKTKDKQINWIRQRDNQLDYVKLQGNLVKKKTTIYSHTQPKWIVFCNATAIVLIYQVLGVDAWII